MSITVENYKKGDQNDSENEPCNTCKHYVKGKVPDKCWHCVYWWFDMMVPED